MERKKACNVYSLSKFEYKSVNFQNCNTETMKSINIPAEYGLQKFANTTLTRSIAVVYANADVGIWLNAQPNSINTVIFHQMDIACIIENAKEREQTIECQNENYFTKTIYMNTTIDSNLSSTSNLAPSVTKPSSATSPPPKISTGVTSKTPNLTPHVTTPSLATSTPPITSTGVTSKTPNLTLHVTTPSLATSLPPTNMFPSENYHILQSYLIYKLLRPYDTYQRFQLYIMYKIFHPNISGMLWFPLGLIRWYQYRTYYSPLRNMMFNVYNLYNIYYRYFISNYFGNQIPSNYSIYTWKPAYLNTILSYYKHIICSRLQYYSMQPGETSAVQQWLRQYFLPGNRQPVWLQQCLKRSNFQKLQLLQLYKLYPSYMVQSGNYYTPFLKLVNDKYYPWNKYLAMMYRNHFPRYYSKSVDKNHPQQLFPGFFIKPGRYEPPQLRNYAPQKRLSETESSDIQNEYLQQLITNYTNPYLLSKDSLSLEFLQTFKRCICK